MGTTRGSDGPDKLDSRPKMRTLGMIVNDSRVARFRSWKRHLTSAGREPRDTWNTDEDEPLKDPDNAEETRGKRMNTHDTKRQIWDLTEEYFSTVHPGRMQEMEKTWRAFEELGLMDQGGIQLRDLDVPPTVGVADATQVLVTGVIIGVISNTVYETLKWSLEKLLEAAENRKWQELFVDELGELEHDQREDAIRAVAWTLARMQIKKRSL
jgi:hypothetical protein